MKYILFIAAVLLVANAEVYRRPTKPISGSFPGDFPPLRDFVSDFVTFTPQGGNFTILAHKVLKESYSGRTITGHALLLSGAGEAYHTYVPKDKCPGTAATSTTAKEHGCYMATNAGFFDMDHGACIGPIVSDGNIVHSASSQGAIFGITSDGKYAAGYANETIIDEKYFSQLVQGRGWLIRNGKSYLDTSAEIEGISRAFIDLIAPRLAIGWDNNGRLILVVVNGIESKKEGIDLNDFVDLLLNLGCIEAINLDGGGSVTFIWDGHFCESSGVGQESCEGNPTEFGPVIYDDWYKPYERPVTSITCFKK